MTEQHFETSGLLDEIRTFRSQCSTLILSTISASGEPLASYAPYIEDDAGCFFVFVSELAAHTTHLTRGTPVSVLFIEDEGQMQQVFARKRLTYAAIPSEVMRGTPDFDRLLDQMFAKHGAIVGLLKKLQDFHLFRITPGKATYVRGFGEAFTLEESDLSRVQPIKDKGHIARA